MKCYNFDDIISHDRIKLWLRQCIDSDRLPQVTLFAGPCGIGKTSIAKIVACEYACRTHPELLQQTKDSIINQNESTECVKLYNLSNLRDKEKIIELRNDFNVGFSNTGRKVLILDEAHGMTSEMQDALLVDLEHLPENVYVIVCTTEVFSMRQAFLSRCVVRTFRPLSARELSSLARGMISDLQLRFSMNQTQAIAYLVSASGNEARKLINLISCLPTESEITAEDLRNCLNLDSQKTIVTLVRNLYHHDILGISIIEELDMSTIQEYLIEVTRVIMGAEPKLFDRESSLALLDITSDDKDTWIRFAAKCLSAPRLSKNNMVGFYLDGFKVDTSTTKELNKLDNAGRVEDSLPGASVSKAESLPTLEDMLTKAPIIMDSAL